MDPIVFTCKRGAVFYEPLRRINPETGAVIAMAPGTQVFSRVRSGGVSWDLTATLIDGPNGDYAISALPTLTETWSVARLEGDVRFGTSADRQFSMTFYINVEDSISL